MATSLAVAGAACGAGGPDEAPSTETTANESPTTGTSSPQHQPWLIGMAFGDKLFFSDMDNPARRHEQQKRLQAAADMGAKEIRLDTDWNILFPNGDQHQVPDEIDQIVTLATEAGMGTLALVAYAAPSQRRADCADRYTCPPRDFHEYARQAAEFARTHQTIRKFELWNEPNIDEFWVSPDPRAYTRFYKEVATAIKAVNQSAVVSLGGLAHAKTDGLNFAPEDFLDIVLSELGSDAPLLVDAVSAHPYTLFKAPGTPDDALSHIEGLPDHPGMKSLYSVLQAHGMAGKEIWLTEFGAATAGGISVPESEQPEIVAKIFGTQFTRANVTALYWYNFQDTVLPGQSGNYEDYFGLRRADGTDKPAAVTFKKLATTR